MKKNVCIFAFVMVCVALFFGCSEETGNTVKPAKTGLRNSTPKSTDSSCPLEVAPKASDKTEVMEKTEKQPKSCSPAKTDVKKEVPPTEIPDEAPKALPKAPEMPKVPGSVTLKDFFKTLEIPEVVATMGDEKITKNDIYKEVESQIPEFMRGKPLPPQVCAQVSDNINLIVDSIVSRKVLLSLAAKDGIKPSPAMLLGKFDEYIKKMSPQDRVMFEAQLKAQNSSIEEHRKKAAEDINSQAAIAIDKWITEKVMPAIEVDDKVVEEYYRENQEKFKKPETIKVAHILIMPKKAAREIPDKSDEEKKSFDENEDIKAKKEAEAILAQLKQGGDFAKIAKEKSACPSKVEGGELPEFDKNGVSPGSRGAMDQIFTAASYKLKPGDISDIVKTPFGYHIIKCIKSNKESYIPLDKVKGFLKGNLKKEQLGKKVKTMVDDEKEKQKVVIHLKKKSPVEEK